MTASEFDRQMVLEILNHYEAMAVAADDADFVFEVMALKEKLGLPLQA